MGRQNFEIIKEDLSNLKNADFECISAYSAYGYMLKVVVSVMIALSLIHISNDYFVGGWSSASVKEVIKHWFSAFTGYSITGFFIFLSTKTAFIMFKQFENILKSKPLIKQFKRNVIILFLVVNIIVDYSVSGHLIGAHTAGSDASGINPWLSLLAIPSLIVCFIFALFEIERLGVGPLLEAAVDAYKRLTRVAS